MSRGAIQDQMVGNHCFGCGADNPDGLQIKSYWRDGQAVCEFRAGPAHMAGPRHVVNGGIIATVIDCHCVCTALADAHQRAGREIGSEPRLWYATATMSLDYLKPAPINETLRLHAQVIAVDGRRSRVQCQLGGADMVYARAEVLAVQVPTSWLEAPGAN